MVEEESSECSSSIIFALSQPWSGAFWSGVGLFACYWVLFGFLVGAMAGEGGWRELVGGGGGGGGEEGGGWEGKGRGGEGREGWFGML